MTSQLQQPHSCWSCGTIIGPAGGRCPTCGAEQPPGSISMMPRPSGVPRPSLEARRAAERRKKWLSIGVLVAGLAGIVGLGLLFAPKQRVETHAPVATSASVMAPAAPPGPTDPNGLGIGDPRAVSPMDLLGRAKTRALAWDRDAILVSIAASPVTGGRVDLTAGGRLEFVFGKLAGAGLGPGAPIKPRVFAIGVDGQQTTAEEGPAKLNRAATEPNCAPEEVASQMQAGGTAAPLDLLYSFSVRHDRIAWRAQPVGDAANARYVDGWNCTILVR